MKTALRIFVSLTSSAVLVTAVSWLFLVHFLRNVEIADQNLNTFMWSVIAVSALAIVGLKTMFYRAVR
jgi:hypothetical protein